MRKSFSAEFKAKVAIESVKGVKTLSELSSLYEVHPNQISNRKKQFLEGATASFSTSVQTLEKQTEEEMNNLYRKIGQLEIENEFLKKSGSRCKAGRNTPSDDRTQSSATKCFSTMYLAQYQS